MTTPVLFLLFNRPDTTARVFAEIRKAKPPRLYVAADGPRPGNSQDVSLCPQTRGIIDQVDWECEVFTSFREENLGCRLAVSSAIDWFFGQEEMGIVLEDDCLPEPSFFTFCEVLLHRYAADERIVHICGVNFQGGIIRGNGDYYFSGLTHVWGWAGWRRAWKFYDVEMKQWDHFRKEGYPAFMFPDPAIRRHFLNMMQRTHDKRINTWDYQLYLSNLIQGGLSIIPNVNLISNIGYGPAATHIKNADPHANLPVSPLYEFKAPDFFLPCFEADQYTWKGFLPGITVQRLVKAVGRRLAMVLPAASRSREKKGSAPNHDKIVQ